MKLKNHIALVLAILILVKFVAIDSQLLGAVFNSDQISWVKKSCKFNGFSDTDFSDSFSESPSGQIINLPSVCNSFFDFSMEEWVEESEELNFQIFGTPIARLNTIFDHRISPPPKA